MTQDERWSIRYDGVMEFITTTHRNPSCHRLEEHGMLNWVKANRKKMNTDRFTHYGFIQISFVTKPSSFLRHSCK